MCNGPEPFVINYAHLADLNRFSRRSNLCCDLIASFPWDIRVARGCFCDQNLDTQDVLDLPVRIVEDCQDMHLMYKEVSLCED